MSDTSKTGRLDFPEGFTVFWDDRELRIDVVDYHAETLHLSWKTILALAQRAGVAGAPTTDRGDADVSPE